MKVVNIYERNVLDKFTSLLVGIIKVKVNTNSEAKVVVEKLINKNWKLVKEKPLFSKVEIETVNRCNNNCPFCPVNAKEDPRPYKIMDMALFRKIIDDLSDLNYLGVISLFSNNEPLIDNRIFDFCEYSKKKLPLAFHYLYTNGILLNQQKLDKLMKNLDYLVIDNYDDSLTMKKNIAEIYEYCKKRNIYSEQVNFPMYNGVTNKERVEIHLRKQNEILSNRAGQAPNKKTEIKTLNASCILPFCQMVIRPDGKVSLCCNDALGSMTLGDLNRSSLSVVWYGEKYELLRKNILKSRALIPLCKNCDVITYS